MIVDSLLDKLEREGYPFDYIGPKQIEIYAVQALPGEVRTTEGEILYVSASETFDEDMITGGSGIVLVDQNESPDHIMAVIQTWLIADIRRKDSLIKLQKDISDGCEISELVRHCSKIMMNPVLLVNHALNIVYQYPEVNFDHKWTVYIADRVEEWRNSKGNIGSASRPHCQIRHIFYHDEGYYICVTEKDCVSDAVCDREYLQRICAAFDTCICNNGREKNDQIQLILTGLLQKRFEYPEKEIKKLKLLGWKSYEKYTVLAIQKGTGLSDHHVCRDLSDLLDTDVYNLGNYYAAVLHSEKHVEYTERDFPELEKYLRKNKLRGVLSMGFFDIAHCAIRFEQSRDCFDVAYAGDDWVLRYYGRYQMTHFISVLNKDCHLDLKSFCSPIILDIYEVDKKQNTDYLSTLYTYICSGQAMKYSADAMGIHVNTMYMRVSRLKDEFKIDFDDAHMIYTLHNSIVFLFLCDNSCLKVAYPCLK